MTDDQLRAMARRVLETVVCPEMCAGGTLRFYPRPEMNGVLCASAIDAAVAILREEMGLAGELQTGWTYSTGTVQGDDPTKSFVATTDAMQQSIARTIEGH